MRVADAHGHARGLGRRQHEGGKRRHMRMHRRIPAVAEGAPQSAHGGERVPVDAGEGKYLRLWVDGAHLFGKIAGNAPCGFFGRAAASFIHKKIKAEPLFGGEAHVV